jgi:hypothetical protein
MAWFARECEGEEAARLAALDGQAKFEVSMRY